MIFTSSIGVSIRPRILVVDDEARIRDVLRRLLESEGYHVETAESGEEALERFRTRGADLVLSDLMMAGMSGTQLLRSAKELDPHVGFIIITGAGTMADAIEALHLHADSYLLKPFNLDEAVLSVRRALERRRLVLENEAYRGRLESLVMQQAKEIEHLYEDALLTLSSAVEARDGYTGGHIERVTDYAVAIGRECGLPEGDVRHLRMAGLLHDVGKLGIPDQVLGKPGALTEAEMAIMRRHPIIGAEILEKSRALHAALPGVLHHHERWDGRGYPYGLRGEEISLQGRILCVADTFDAIITARPYRSARSVAEALEELERCAGTQFDPELVDVFLRIVRAGGAGVPRVEDAIPA